MVRYIYARDRIRC